jgi:phosphonate transport system substrate-binding protein
MGNKYIKVILISLGCIICVISILYLSSTWFHNSNIPRVIKVAVIPSEDAEMQLLHLEPLKNYLSKQLGVRFEFIITNNYNASIEALRARQVQMAWLGPFSYVLARELVNIEPVVGGIRKDTRNVFYNSIILVRKDANIKTINDLRGHSFAFIDPASTSGYLMPLAKLLDLGIVLEKDFTSVVYAGSHTAVELALAHNQVDAIADSRPSYDLMVKNKQIDPKEVDIVWTSTPIPPSPFVVRSDLGEKFIAKIRTALITAGPEVVSFEGDIIGYAAVHDSDYNVIRSVARKVGIRKKS